MKKDRRPLRSVSRGRRDRQSAPVEEPVSKAPAIPALKSAAGRKARPLSLRKKAAPAASARQSGVGARDNDLELAIGHEVRAIRTSLGMTASDLARATHLSLGMLSKIENGLTSASLTTLQRVAVGLGVQVTTLFRRFDEARDAIYVRSGRGAMERCPNWAGEQSLSLGYPEGLDGSIEPQLITLTEKTHDLPAVKHAGYAFIYMLQGEVIYRHSDKVYRMRLGDSLYFNAAVEHGLQELVKLPVRLLSVTGSRRNSVRS